MGANVAETFLSRLMLEIDVRNIAEDIAASNVPLAKWKPLKVTPITCGRVLSGNSHNLRSARRTTPAFEPESTAEIIRGRNPRRKKQACRKGTLPHASETPNNQSIYQ